MRSRRVPSIQSSFLRTEKQSIDAAGFFINAVFPLKNNILVQAELDYLTTGGAAVESGFGDFNIRGRMRMLKSKGSGLFLTAGLRTGSGTRDVYPYASGSVDLDLGVSMIDSLSQVVVWGGISAVSVNRMPELPKAAARHSDYGTISMGVLVPVTPSFVLRFSGTYYTVFQGGAREIYYAGASYLQSGDMHFFLTLQAEGGSIDERVYDTGLRSGIRIFY